MTNADYARLAGAPSRAQLGIARKLSTQYSFVRKAVPAEKRLEDSEPKPRGIPHATLDLQLDRALRQRNRLGSRAKIGVASPTTGLGMRSFLRRANAAGRRIHVRAKRDHQLAFRDAVVRCWNIGVHLPSVRDEMRRLVRVVKHEPTPSV